MSGPDCTPPAEGRSRSATRNPPWTYGGAYGYPGPGATAPTSPGAIPTAATAGALPLTLTPRSGNALYLGRSKFVYLHSTLDVMGGSPTLRAPLRLYDRLYHCQFTCVLNGTVSINGATVTRGAVGGVGNCILLETIDNPQGGSMNVNYINQDGVQKQTSPAVSVNGVGSGQVLQ